MLDWPLLIAVMLVASIILLGFITLLLHEIRGKQKVPSFVPRLIVGVSVFLFAGLILALILVLAGIQL